ncbi:MAG: ABC transporter permease, partial [Betaproteobacteria bacterium]|nr:ABC transporter permease [Betaproteobacteria bacterium]
MALPYELLIGLRYTRAKRRNHFISFISLISMLGIGLGVAALIVVLSVMNGFQKELRTRILGVASHIQITGINGELTGWQAIAQQALKHPEVRAAAPFVQSQGMFSVDGGVKGTLVRGIVPELEDKVADFRKTIQAGSLDDLRPGEFGVVLGADLARSLRVFTGDKVTLIAPQGTVTPAGVVPRLKSFRVVGIFEVGMY